MNRKRSKESYASLPEEPKNPSVPPLLCRTIGLKRCQSLQIEQPAYQERFLPDIAQRSPEESAESMFFFRFTPEFFNLFTGSLAYLIAKSSLSL
ncbi:MAG: hypothetical protein WC329_03135 [Candidatus Omnitrophota bacterium]|jgi:hypothetical protein